MKPAGEKLRAAVLIRKWNGRGGNERVARALVEALLARGHAVRVICQKYERSPTTPAPNVPLHILGGPSFDPALAMFTFARKSARCVEALRRDKIINVAIGFNHTSVQDVYRLGAGTHAAYLAATGVRPSWRDRVVLSLERRRFLLPSTLFIAPSHNVKREVELYYPDCRAAVQVLPNGVDREVFRPEGPSDERARIRAEWEVGPSDKVALFVGRDPFLKGLDLAYAAAALAGCRLVCVGDLKCPKSSYPSARFIGERAAVAPHLRAADVLLAPSRYEAFGGVVLEALASGLPSVAPRRIGAAEALYGTALESLLVDDPRDAEALSRALKRALDPAQSPTLRALVRGLTTLTDLRGWSERFESLLLRLIA